MSPAPNPGPDPEPQPDPGEIDPPRNLGYPEIVNGDGPGWDACLALGSCALSSIQALADGPSLSPDVSADGLVVAFHSSATNLVPGDTNEATDVFLVDLAARTIEVVSRGLSGEGANGASEWPTLSADGQRIAFASRATNLVEGAPRDKTHSYVYDRKTGQTTLVSVSASGEPLDEGASSPRISADGSRVLMTTHSSNTTSHPSKQDAVVYDIENGTLLVASESYGGGAANQISNACSLSQDGSTALFRSSASNLLSGGVTSPSGVFARDFLAEATTPLVYPRGLNDACPDGPAGDGWVALASESTEIVPGTTGDFHHIYRFHLATQEVELVSVRVDGEVANDHSGDQRISGDGLSIVFSSVADNLFESDDNYAGDVFLYSALTQEVTLVSGALDGTPGENASFHPSVSHDGKAVVFASEADDIFPGDTNRVSDVVLVRLP